MRTFENLSNGYRVTVGWMSGLGTFFLGMFYFAAKGLWRHAVIMTLIAIMSFGLLGLGGFLILIPAWIVYAFLTPDLLATDLLRKGWREVESLSSPQTARGDPAERAPLYDGSSPPATSVADTKTCPYCAENIKRAAVVCRFCGRDLQQPEAGGF